MTHTYVTPNKLFGPTMIDDIRGTYFKAGSDNSVLVISVVLAFYKAYYQRSEIIL